MLWYSENGSLFNKPDGILKIGNAIFVSSFLDAVMAAGKYAGLFQKDNMNC